MRYALTVQYIGKGYAGSQIQFENGKEIALPTIQGELEKALSTLIKPKRCVTGADLREQVGQGEALRNRRCDSNDSEWSEAIFDCTGGKRNKNRPIRAIFSGRTDKGVNSLGQVVHFDTDERLKEDKEVYRRTACYHFFTNYRKRFRIKALNYFFTFIERCSLATQVALGIDRTKKYNFTIKYGSQWFSITDKLAKYIVMNEEKINKIFNKTKCADELFVQTIVYNSDFKEKLYDKNFDDNCLANMRLIDIKKRGKNGSPYIWQYKDLEEIKRSKCLFARKFDINKDKKIVREIIKISNGGKKDG